MGIKPGEWNRFRVLFASIYQQLEVYLDPNPRNELPMPQCEMQLLAKDGIYLHTLPRLITMFHLHAGARADFAIRCTCEQPPCSAAFAPRKTSNMWRENLPGSSPPVYEGTLIELEVVGTPVPSEDLPTVKLNRPCYLADLTKANVAGENKHVIKMKQPFFPPHHNTGMAWDSDPWFVLGHGNEMPH